MKNFYTYLAFLAFVFIFLAPALKAQNGARIDRLAQSLEKAGPEEKISIYNDLAFQYRTVDSKKTIEYCQMAIALSDSIAYNLQLPRSYNFIGLAHFNNSNYPEALRYFNIGEEKAIELNDSTELGFSYQNKAGVYRWLGDFASAMENAFNAETIFRKTNNSAGLAYTFGTLAGLYLDQHEPHLSLKYSQKAISTMRATGRETSAPTFLLARADALAYLKKYAEAFEQYSEALNRYVRNGHHRGILITNIRMAKMFYENGDKNAARARLAKARSIHEKYGLNTELTALFMLEGQLYLTENALRKASVKLKKAEAFALKTNRRQELSEIYRLLAGIYETKKDFPASLAYFKSHSILRDSLFSENVSKTIGNLESEIALSKKQDEVIQLQLEKSKSEEKLESALRFRVGLGLMALLLACIILVVYRNYRIKKRSNVLLTRKNEKINRQSEILQKQAKELTKAQKGLKQTNEQLEEKVRQRTAELSRSNADLERFAFIASHDMKEPLRTITSFSQLLQRELKNEKVNKKKVKEYLKFITSGTLNMNLLVQDQLTYSKLKESPEEPFSVLCFDNVINTVLKNLDNQIRSNEVELYFKNLPNSVYGIEVMLVQLFQNLISNAIKFRKKGEPCIIELKAREKTNRLVFSITDNGIGIDPKYHKRIFELFRKLHSRMVYEGSGIGLSICKRIVELHEGEIWLESEAGEGTVFYFSLPKAGDGVKVSAEVVEEGSDVI